MEAFFTSGHAIDAVLAIMVIEILYLIRRKRTDPLSVILAVLPGMLILLAMRLAITGAPWPAVAALLLTSWPVHIADIKRRRW